MIADQQRARRCRKQRIYRQGQRDRLSVLRVEAAPDVVLGFMAAGWLTPDEALDRRNIERVAAVALRQWAHDWLIAKGEM